MIEKIIKKYRKETEEAFWKLAYKLAMNYDLIPINKGVYELREKRLKKWVKSKKF